MGKAQQLLAGLQATGDESRQLQAAIEMCQVLKYDFLLFWCLIVFANTLVFNASLAVACYGK